MPDSMPEASIPSRASLVSPCRVTTADPLVACIACLLLLELFENVVERLEALVPRLLVALHPVMDGLERAAVEPVDPAASVLEHVDRPHFAQHAQVLGHLRLGQRERLDEVVDGVLSGCQK